MFAIFISVFLDKNFSATNIFCSFDILNPSILLLSGSIVTYNQIYSKESALIRTSHQYNEYFNSSSFLVKDSSSFSIGLYFRIHQFHIEPWFRLINMLLVYHHLLLFLKINLKSRNIAHSLYALRMCFFASEGHYEIESTSSNYRFLINEQN